MFLTPHFYDQLEPLQKFRDTNPGLSEFFPQRGLDLPRDYSGHTRSRHGCGFVEISVGGLHQGLEIHKMMSSAETYELLRKVDFNHFRKMVLTHRIHTFGGEGIMIWRSSAKRGHGTLLWARDILESFGFTQVLRYDNTYHPEGKRGLWMCHGPMHHKREPKEWLNLLDTYLVTPAEVKTIWESTPTAVAGASDAIHTILPQQKAV